MGALTEKSQTVYESWKNVSRVSLKNIQRICIPNEIRQRVSDTCISNSEGASTKPGFRCWNNHVMMTFSCGSQLVATLGSGLFNTELSNV